MTDNKFCDFCKRPNPYWRYPCRSFAQVPFGALQIKARMDIWWGSDNDWAACEDCAPYIEDNKLDDLAFLISGLEAARYLASSGRELNSETEGLHIIIYGELKKLYRNFSKNRKGSRVLA